MCIHTCQVSHSDNGYVIKFYSTLLCSSSFAVQFSLLLLIFCSDLFTPHLDLSGSRGPLTCWFLTTCSVINTCTTEGVSRGVVGNCVTSVCDRVPVIWKVTEREREKWADHSFWVSWGLTLQAQSGLAWRSTVAVRINGAGNDGIWKWICFSFIVKGKLQDFCYISLWKRFLGNQLGFKRPQMQCKSQKFIKDMD